MAVCIKEWNAIHAELQRLTEENERLVEDVRMLRAHIANLISVVARKVADPYDIFITEARAYLERTK